MVSRTGQAMMEAIRIGSTRLWKDRRSRSNQALAIA
jgi:hypothetical protein